MPNGLLPAGPESAYRSVYRRNFKLHGVTIRFPAMEPVPRPEWAFPIEVGVHVRSFHSALPEQPTREVLQVLCDDPKLLGFLERHPLGRLEFSGRLPEPTWMGFYDPDPRDLVVNSCRTPETYGHEFYPPQLASVSAAGGDLVEAMQRTLYHELGHAIFDAAGPEIAHRVATLLWSRRAMPVSHRARRDPGEYFCETFAAYRFIDELADKGPEGYDMIEAILRRVWKT